MNVLTRFPISRLSGLASRFGGLSREEAVEAATRELQVMRPESDRAILCALEQLEKIVKGAIKHNDAVLMRELLRFCDQIVTLAGTFGYRAMDKAARSLCDLLDGLLGQGKSDFDSIRVHVQTMRIFAPSAALTDKEQIEVMLFELARLLDHHDIVTKINGGDSDDDRILVAR